MDSVDMAKLRWKNTTAAERSEAARKAAAVGSRKITKAQRRAIGRLGGQAKARNRAAKIASGEITT